MKLPDNKRVADLSAQEREEVEAAMADHIEAYENIATAVDHAIAELQMAVGEAVRNEAPGIMQVIVALDPLAAAIASIGAQVREHAKEDSKAFEEGLEGLERLGAQREQEEKEGAALAKAGLGSIIRPKAQGGSEE